MVSLFNIKFTTSRVCNYYQPTKSSSISTLCFVNTQPALYLFNRRTLLAGDDLQLPSIAWGSVSAVQVRLQFVLCGYKFFFVIYIFVHQISHLHLFAIYIAYPYSYSYCYPIYYITILSFCLLHLRHHQMIITTIFTQTTIRTTT